VRGADEVDDRPLVAGIGVQSGSTLSTSVGGRVALRLADGGELRLDRSTRLRFESPRRLRLLQGALYVDSDAGAGEQGLRETASELEIVTDQAIARDVGTRFEVRLDGRSYRLRVRDGRVDLRHASGLYSSGPGEQLLIESDGRVRPGRIVLDDADWAWIETLSTAPEIENQPLRRVLDWVTRETGRPIRFSPGELEHDASRAILHGSIDGLAPLDALATVLASSGLRYRIERDGSILISKD
jgi:ferric-dicitrate binding protein FerR (iron transport regulator)